RAVDNIGVVALAADHGVGAALAIEDVVAVVAGEAVRKLVAGRVDVRRAAVHQRQVLDAEAGEVERHPAVDGVDSAGVDLFVAEIVDEIGVVSEAALHGVGAALAVEDVGRSVAVKMIVVGVAGGVDGAAADQLQILEVTDEYIGDRAVDDVMALAW